jgi:hypothetical protein
MSNVSISRAIKYGPEVSNERPHVITSVKPFTKIMQKYFNDEDFAQRKVEDEKVKIFSKDYFNFCRLLEHNVSCLTASEVRFS